MSDKMSCGHEYRYISRSDERTNFCVWCEWQATVAALAQAQAERDAAIEDAHSANAQIEVERNAQRVVWNELRDLFDCKPEESLVAVCNKTISDLNILGAENTKLQNALDDAVARRDAASERADRAETALQRVRAERDAATARATSAEDAAYSAQREAARLSDVAKQERDLAVGFQRDISHLSSSLAKTELARRNATRRAEQAEAVLSEQADIITANLWNIPPKYAARNILLDVAMKMRAALAGPEGGQR